MAGPLELAKVLENRKNTLNKRINYKGNYENYITGGSHALNNHAKLWDTNFDIANLVWLTYLKFKPEYDKFCQKAWKLKYNKNNGLEKQNLLLNVYPKYLLFSLYHQHQ